MHKYAHDTIDEGVSYDEMVAYLRAKKIDTDYHQHAIIRAYGDIFFSPSDGEIAIRANAFTHNQSRHKHHMAPEAYFRYLGYLEYKQASKNAADAQKSSKTAITYARWALFLSALVGLAQIAVSIFDVKIDLDSIFSAVL